MLYSLRTAMVSLKIKHSTLLLDSITKYWKFHWSLHVLHSLSIFVFSILVNHTQKQEVESKYCYVRALVYSKMSFKYGYALVYSTTDSFASFAFPRQTNSRSSSSSSSSCRRSIMLQQVVPSWSSKVTCQLIPFSLVIMWLSYLSTDLYSLFVIVK